MRQNNEKAPLEHLIYVPPVSPRTVYHDTPLSFTKRAVPFAKSRQIPQKILKMNSLYDYTLPPLTGRAKNFYVQGQNMANYQDDYDYQGSFHRYFPVYHDMTTAQLRGYFTWRTKIRAGKYQKTSASFVYVYLYELINQVGVTSPLDGYHKLITFKDKYMDFMDARMVKNIDQWLRDYVIYYQLGSEYIKKHFADQIADNIAYGTLVDVTDIPAGDVLAALDSLSSYQLDHCPLKKQDPSLLAAIVKSVWQRLCALPDEDICKDLLGWQGESVQRPFANAVFYNQQINQPFTCKVDDYCTYTYHQGKWTYQYYLPAKRQAQKIGSLLHEIDRLIRQKLRVGRPLKPRPLRAKLLAEIKPAILAAQRQVEAARRPKVKIDLAHLGQIRADASITQENLLTDEERKAEKEEAGQTKQPATNSQSPMPSPLNDLGLSADEQYLLTKLLAGEEWSDYFKQRHLMVSVVVDRINDKLFDEIGDTVIEFDAQDRPQIIEDYCEDIKELIS
ncbi:TerB N-terminal domain-containing protein [Limosilactobacillus sp. STM2_1]|uniref:TerB N-terminal domain-containing protein n=1 Tax=Limosilactobacillus rudii TaxID=2759755 RepID=A0A7W3YN13_9LACO|nr:TerB N-terminal domain-containing protein [Limosilactobacillus rudii]MBB1079577.1 TerB N-terminal domain-containing protein [Limosilactobacillus rudii]MBB1097623.1 TerB N-terminal domain-containing protein [Limosilactobacillus rudii]MCD7134732.1 TerB N-terminal domain-containing protein [Limosilactobacillus rudii]